MSEAHKGRMTRHDIKALRGPLTQAEFAQLVKVDQGTVSRWETGALQVQGPTLILMQMLRDQGLDVIRNDKRD